MTSLDEFVAVTRGRRRPRCQSASTEAALHRGRPQSIDYRLRCRRAVSRVTAVTGTHEDHSRIR
jgi:hypothetical protein